MARDVSITEIDGGKVALVAPYDAQAVTAARQIGGRWNPKTKAWVFDSRDKGLVEDLASRFYGWSPDVPGAETVTIRWTLGAVSRWDAELRLLGRRIASRPGRDAPVMPADGVVVVDGAFPLAGGSKARPEVDGIGVTVEVRDLPRPTAEAMVAKVDDLNSKVAGLGGAAHIVEDQTDDEDSESTRDALIAEREQLFARLAEIDDQLGTDDVEPAAEATDVDEAQALAITTGMVGLTSHMVAALTAGRQALRISRSNAADDGVVASSTARALIRRGLARLDSGQLIPAT